LGSSEEKDIRLDELIRRNYKRIYRIAYSKLRNTEDAGDTTQNTFAMFVCQYDQKEYYKDMSDEEMERLLTCIVLRRVANFMRDKVRKQAYPDEFIEELAGTSVEEVVFGEIGAEIIRESIKELPERYATYMYLAYEIDMSPEAIAGVLNVKTDSVRSIASRARKKLKKICEEKGVEVNLRGRGEKQE